MIDLMSAVQAAVLEQLAAGVALATVHDHLKQGTPPPFVRVGTIEGLNEGGKGEQRELYQVEIHSVFQGSDRVPLFEIMHQVREALEGAALTAPGAEFSAPEFISQAASDAASDGVTYAGISTFEIYAEPA